MSANVTGVDSRDDDIDLHELIGVLWSRRWWLVVSVVLFTAVFATAAFVMTPIYRASTVAMPAAEDRNALGAFGSALGQLGGLATLAGINVGNPNAQTDEALAVLRSREFTEEFIKDHDLMPVLFANRWDKAQGKWRGEPDDAPTLAQAYKFFDKSVRTVSQDRKTKLITITVEWRDRVLAANWANALVARLNAEMRARAIAATNASLGYLQKELAVTSTVETRDAISRLFEAQINQRMLANVTEQYALRVVDRALPPDKKDIAQPKKLLLLLIGFGLGVFAGVAGIWASVAFLNARAASPRIQ